MKAFSRCLLLIGAALGFLGANSTSDGADFCPPNCGPSGKIPLGLAAPMSGPVAVFGRQTAKAVEIAVQQLNSAGGVMGLPVLLAIGDDRCDAGMASTVAARHINQDKIKFVIGPICPSVAMDAAPIYGKAGVVQLVPTVTIVDLTRQSSETIFRIAANDEQEAQALGGYFTAEKRSKTLTVVYSDYSYRRAMAEMVRLALPAEMKRSTHFEPLREVSGAADRLAEKLQKEPTDIVYLALDGAPAAEFVGKLQARGVKSFLMSTQHMLSQAFWQHAGVRAEAVNVIAPIESLNRPAFRNAIDQLKHAGIVPDLVAVYSYVAVQIWAEAVRQVGSGDPKKVAEALRSVEFLTAIGRVMFDQKGDRRDLSYSVVTAQLGPLPELRMVQQSDVLTPSIGTSRAPSKPATAATTSEDVVTFDKPLSFGPFPVNGKSIKQLADGVPLFAPVEGQNEPVWKKNCSNCHKWDRQSLCDQGATYVANPQNVLRVQHPYGGPFKVALLRWAKSGCR